MTKHLGLCYTCAEAASTASSPSDYSQPALSLLDDSYFINLPDEIVRELQQSIMEIDIWTKLIKSSLKSLSKIGY